MASQKVYGTHCSPGEKHSRWFKTENIIISFFGIKWSFISKNLSPHHTRMLCAKFGWNWTSRSGEDFFLKTYNICIFDILVLFPIAKGNKLESPLPEVALCKIWLKVAQWFLKKDKNMKSLQTDRWTTSDQKRSLEL